MGDGEKHTKVDVCMCMISITGEGNQCHSGSDSDSGIFFLLDLGIFWGLSIMIMIALQYVGFPLRSDFRVLEWP